MTFDSIGAKTGHSAVKNKAQHCSRASSPRGAESWAAWTVKFCLPSGNSVITLLSIKNLKFMAQHG